jgi:predicted Zn finger-like uncharacterized protein
MILSCPACATRYVVDPASLGADGRRVRCARCAETWYQEPPAKPDFVKPEPLPVTAPAMVGGGMAATVDEAMPSFFNEKSRPTWSNLPAVTKPKRRVSGILLGWIGLVLIVGLVLAGSWYFAPTIMSHWPASARLYSALGMASRPADSGLELRGTNSARGAEDGVATVIVTGEIANVSDGPRQVPKLRLSLRNAKGDILKSMDFPPPRDELKPGESVPYQASIPAPENPDDAASALVAFVTR